MHFHKYFDNKAHNFIRNRYCTVEFVFLLYTLCLFFKEIDQLIKIGSSTIQLNINNKEIGLYFSIKNYLKALPKI